MTVTTPGNVLEVTACRNGSAAQRFGYSGAAGQITAVVAGQTLCVTAGNSAPPTPGGGSTAVYGRPLTGGSWAVAMLNNSPRSQNITCDHVCLARMGFDDSHVRMLTVRDLWLHRNVSEVAVGQGTASSLSYWVPANGSTALLKLMPSALVPLQ